MGNKSSYQSLRSGHQQQWPSAQSVRGASAVGSDQQLVSQPLSVPLTTSAALPVVQQIHGSLINQSPSSLSSDSSHQPQAAPIVQSRRADDQFRQPHSGLQAGSEQHQIIPFWLSEPSPPLISDRSLPSLTARRAPHRRENDYVTFPLQMSPAIEERRQTVPLQPLVPPESPIARRSSFGNDSAAPFAEAVHLRDQAVHLRHQTAPPEPSPPRCTAVNTVDALLDSSAAVAAALSPPLLPQRAATPPLLPSPFQKPPVKPPSHRPEVRQLPGSDSCDGNSPLLVDQTVGSALPSPRPLQNNSAMRPAPSTFYGLQRSPAVLNLPDLMSKSPAAAPGKLLDARKFAKIGRHRRPASNDAQRISPASIAAPGPSIRDASSIETGRRRSKRKTRGVHNDNAVETRQVEVEDDELRALIALRERRRPPPPQLSGAALESYLWEKLRPSKSPSAKMNQSRHSIGSHRFRGEGEPCTTSSSRKKASSRRVKFTESFGEAAAAPGELSVDGGATASRRTAGESVGHDLPASSLAPSTSAPDARTTANTQRRTHRESSNAHEGRNERRRHVKALDEELLARVAIRQRRWVPPPKLSNEALERCLWAKLRPAKSRSAKRGQWPPVPLLSAIGFDASRAFSPRRGCRKTALTEFGGLADGYYADTEEDDELRRERSRFEQECYDAELSQRFAAAAAMAAAPRVSHGLFPDSSAPTSSSAGASWASAKAPQKPTMSEFVTNSASSRSALPQVCSSLSVPSASTNEATAGSSVVRMPLCGRLQPQAQVYSNQPMVPK